MSSDIEIIEPPPRQARRPPAPPSAAAAVIDLLSSPIPASKRPSHGASPLLRSCDDLGGDDDELPSLGSVLGGGGPAGGSTSNRPGLKATRTEPLLSEQATRPRYEGMPSSSAGTAALKRHATTTSMLPPKRAPIIVEDSMELDDSDDFLPADSFFSHPSDSLSASDPKGKGKARARPVDDYDGEFDFTSAMMEEEAFVVRSAEGSGTTALSVGGAKRRRTGGITAEEKLAKKEAAAQAKEAKKAAVAQEKAIKATHAAANKLTHNRKKTASEVHLLVPHMLLARQPPASKDGFAKTWLCVVDRFSRAREEDQCDVNDPRLVGPAPEAGGSRGREREGEEEEVEVDVIRWERDAVKEWHEGNKVWVPFADGRVRKVDEGTVCLYWSAKEVNEWVAEVEGQRGGQSGCLRRVLKVKREHPGKQIFVLVQGLHALYRAESSAASAATTAAIRAQLSASSTLEPDARPNPRARTVGGTVGKAAIERELEKVRMVTGALLVVTEGREDTADWLLEMTLEIGVRPYKTHKHQMQDAHHLTGSEPKGKDMQDTYIKMLATINRLTEGEAAGIVAWYPTLRSLYEGWEHALRTGGEIKAREMLVGAAKGRKVDGTSTGRKIGKEGSRKVYEIMFAQRDGDSFAY